MCFQDGHVGVIRVRQQPKCNACDTSRSTLTLYAKHLQENHHRENVKKLCQSNAFIPTIYDKAIQLGLQNNVNH